MFIDSPDFFKRKVLLNRNSSALTKVKGGYPSANAYEYGM
jgi:hypothetical protein